MGLSPRGLVVTGGMVITGRVVVVVVTGGSVGFAGAAVGGAAIRGTVCSVVVMTGGRVTGVVTGARLIVGEARSPHSTAEALRLLRCAAVSLFRRPAESR